MQTGTRDFLINTYGENNWLSFFLARIITENGLIDEKNTESLICARLYLFCSPYVDYPIQSFQTCNAGFNIAGLTGKRS